MSQLRDVTEVAQVVAATREGGGQVTDRYAEQGAAAGAQKDVTVNFILLVRKGTQLSEEDVQRVNALRAQFESYFTKATGGRATLSTTVGSK